ncbi:MULTISPECIES: B12-binding domain-containing radical SAM protein [Actinoalloteichus]|uniref:B12-binding domain-containing radical SAM protein n=1 Tax=Actinoalloteichus TaxID=65496 RepID=UPI0018DDF3C6|nr:MULTISPECIES: radical SAM protein [Actinoalloteichus]
MTPPPVTHRTAEENLGLGYLAAVLREDGFEVRVLDGWLAGLTASQLASAVMSGPVPLFVGFACYRSNMDSAVTTAALVRSGMPDVPIVAGGFGPSFHTGDFLAAGFDVVVRGEGELTVVELARFYRDGTPVLDSILGISFRAGDGVVHRPARPLIADLDTVPMPARDTLGLTLARRSPVHVQTSRGCQASCTFCSIVAFERLGGGPTWRQRSISGVVDELAALAARGVEHVKVIDDSLLEPPRDLSWCSALADEIARRGVRVALRGQIRADRVDDAVLAELRRAGFWSFACGIENFSPTALRRMAKRSRVENNVAALEAFRLAGMYVQAGHILFDHATTTGELEENWAGMARFSWTISKGVFTEMYAAAGTAYTRALARTGRLEAGPAAAGTAGLGNAVYAVADPAAAAAYAALKRWQRSHARIYDQTVDPLAAPKALAPRERPEFHQLCVALREEDLRFFRSVLDLVHAGACVAETVEFTEARIVETAPFYVRATARVEHAYRRAGLVYDAEDNPFLC